MSYHFLVGGVFLVVTTMSHGQKNYTGCSTRPAQKLTTPGVLSFDHQKYYAQDSSIVKPHFGLYYYTTCRWLVTVPRDHFVYLKFQSISLYNDKNCNPWSNSLIIFDSSFDSNNINWRCNIHGRPTFLSSGRNMLIRFHHMFDFDKHYMGNFEFTAVLTAVSINNTKCQSGVTNLIATNQSRHVMTPLFPSYSTPSQYCTWLITSTSQHVVYFRFSHFKIDESVKCDGSYFEARDGDRSDSPLLVKLCGTDYKCPIVSSGRHMWIRYKTGKGRNNMNAFRAEYITVRKGIANATVLLDSNSTEVNASITKEDIKRNDNITCTWAFKVPRGRRLNLTVSLMPPVQQGCSKERIDIIRGQSLHGPPIMSTNVSITTARTETLAIGGQYLIVRLVPNRKGTSCTFMIQIKSWIKTPRIIFTPPSTIGKATKPTLVSVLTTSYHMSTSFTSAGANDAELLSQPAENTTWTNVGVGLGTGVTCIVIVMCFVVIRKKMKSHRCKRALRSNVWEIESSKVVLLEELGEGAFGKVWKGFIRRKDISNKMELGQLAESGGNSVLGLQKETADQSMVVAVKTLHSGDEGTEQKNEFLLEIEFMKTVGYHRNIICMLACCTLEENVLLVVEYAENGDLLTFLRNTRKKMIARASCQTELLGIYGNQVNITSPDRTDSEFPMQKLQSDFMSFSWQIAKGMEFLASKRIVHRDLAARNILLTDAYLIKVADFGLSRQTTYKEQIYKAQGRRKLPIKWMAPEAIFEETFTTKSDVWSYGVVLWEIYSMGGAPYPTISNAKLVHQLRKGHRMEIPDLCPDDMYEIMKSCWNGQAEERPSFSDVIQNLETLMTRDNPYIEFTGIDENMECYMVPSFNSAPDETDEEDDTLA